MASRYLTTKTPSKVDKIYYELPNEGKQIINCAVCGEVEVPSSYIVYKYNDKSFCSHNCKHKYIREHPEEEELSDSERIVNALTIHEMNKNAKRGLTEK